MGVKVSSQQRFSRGATCPICGGRDGDRRGGGTRCHGFLSEDGNYAHCSREEHANGAPYSPESATFTHKLNGPCACGVEHGPAKPRSSNWRDEPKRIVAEYEYRDESGKLLFQAIRYEDKSFTQRKPGPHDGTWVWSTKGVRRVLYRLPELIGADPSRPVLLAEGEKDVDNLRSKGLIATCNPMGAKKWNDDYSPFLAGRAVWIVPDNDQDGATHAEHVAKSVAKLARSVKVLDLAGLCRTLGLGDLKEKGDASDFLKMGGTAEQLVAAFEATPEYVAPKKARAKQPTEEAPPRPSETPADDDRPADGSMERFNRTDFGNAQRLVHLYRDRIRFHTLWKSWLIFDGRRWKEDLTGQIVRFAKRTVRLIYREAAGEVDESKREALAKWAITSESRSRIDNMIALAQTEPGIPVLHDELDTDPFLFNVENGTIDLRTGKLHPHRREDLITKLAKVAFDPEAEAPLWDGFLEKILGVHPETIDFMRRAAGYAMTADTSEQCLFFLHGEGANGKSTLLSTIERTLGEYAITIDPKILTSKDHDEHPTELCDLDGPRFVNTVEVDDGKKMAEGLVKRLTGGTDKIRARRMRRDPYQFDPRFKLFLAANHKPVIRGTDHGIWRRIRMVPFEYTIRDDEKDKDFDKKLLAEKAGILAWCVRGCLEWQLGGLKPPKSVMDATAEYRTEMDSIQKFLDQRCVIDRETENYRCKFPDIRRAYESWCADYGIKFPMGGKKLGEELAAKGFRKKESHGNTFYYGLALAPQPMPRPNDDEIDFNPSSGGYRWGNSAS